jgi:tyrosine-protein phosphatase SIW14
MRFWRHVHALTVSLVFASIMCATSYVPQTASPTASSRPANRSFAHPLKITGIPNAGEVTPTLFRGGQPDTTGFEALARMGINIVVDLRGSRKAESELVTKLGMRYVSIPWHCPFPKDDAMARFLILLRENPGRKVFVHCRLGDDRTGMTIAAYRMAEQGWTAMQAKQEMEAFGFTLPHHFICPSLASYEENFPERFRTNSAFHSLRAPASSSSQSH